MYDVCVMLFEQYTYMNIYDIYIYIYLNLIDIHNIYNTVLPQLCISLKAFGRLYHININILK